MDVESQEAFVKGSGVKTHSYVQYSVFSAMLTSANQAFQMMFTYQKIGCISKSFTRVSVWLVLGSPPSTKDSSVRYLLTSILNYTTHPPTPSGQSQCSSIGSIPPGPLLFAFLGSVKIMHVIRRKWLLSLPVGNGADEPLSFIKDRTRRWHWTIQPARMMSDQYACSFVIYVVSNLYACVPLIQKITYSYYPFANSKK